MKPVVIFTATRWELRALRRAFPTAQPSTIGSFRCLAGQQAGCLFWLVQTGVGPDAAAQAAAAVMDRCAIESAISAGFACALTSSHVGDLMVGIEVSSVQRNPSWSVRDDTVRCDEGLTGRILAAVKKTALPVQVGKIISTSTVVGQAGDKRQLSRLNGAIAFDMESAAVGTVVTRRGVPYAIVRAVSDLVGEELPLDFNLFLKSDEWFKGVQSILCRPSSLVGLNRLRRQSGIAADRLTKWFASYMTEHVRCHEVESS